MRLPLHKLTSARKEARELYSYMLVHNTPVSEMRDLISWDGIDDSDEIGRESKAFRGVVSAHFEKLIEERGSMFWLGIIFLFSLALMAGMAIGIVDWITN